MKIKVNDNLTNIFNFIESRTEPIKYQELVQFVIDYDLYQEFYMNNVIVNKLFDEKMKSFERGNNEKEAFDFIG